MSEPSPRPAIPSVTALRGIAALLVVVYHCEAVLFVIQLGPILHGTGLISRGYLWVDFFFVLSGFIITHVYGQTFTGGVRKADLRAFLLARFSRLYPLHFVALTLTVAQYVGIYSKMPGAANMAELYPWPALPFHYLLLISFGLTGMTWNVPAWSIGAEWWTYLLTLPAFRWLNRGVSKRTWIVPILCSAGLWLLMTLYPYHALNITFDYGLLRCVLEFVIGICLYQLHRANVGGARVAGDAAFLVALAAAALVLHYPEPPPPPADMKTIPAMPPLTPVMDALSPLVFAGLILCAARNAGKVRAFLESRPLRGLGEISYSIYLMQGMAFPILFLGGSDWKGKHPGAPLPPGLTLALLAGTLALNIVLAMGTYRWVEVPARRWLRRRFGGA